MSIHKECVILVSIYIYVMGLCNFFFVPQDLIDRISSYYFQRIDFQGNTMSQAFSDENKQPLLEWHSIYLYGEIMVKSCW